MSTAMKTMIALLVIALVALPVTALGWARAQTAPAVGGNVRIASANVLNFFTTFTNGQTVSGQTGQGCSLGGASSAANCRGANNLDEFNRQKAKIVASLSRMNADVVGLMEIQNNGQVAVQHLVDSLNAVLGAGTYASVALPSDTGDDAIRVAMIYKPAKLSPVGTPLSDTDPVNNRPTLAQAFRAANGERFAVLVNHLKSKSCSSASGTGAAPDRAMRNASNPRPASTLWPTRLPINGRRNRVSRRFCGILA